MTEPTIDTILKATQAIKALIADEVKKARINELVVYDHAIRSGKPWIAYIKDRLAELQSTQPSNKSKE